MAWLYDDGGRISAGYKGNAGDCVVRAIAIAAWLPYQQVYSELKSRNERFAEARRCQVARRLKEKGASPRNGNFDRVYDPLLTELGWKWTPTMSIGSGCRVHLKADELPKGRLIVAVSKHLVAVVDGVIYDTHDPSRDAVRVRLLFKGGVMKTLNKDKETRDAILQSYFDERSYQGGIRRFKNLPGWVLKGLVEAGHASAQDKQNEAPTIAEFLIWYSSLPKALAGAVTFHGYAVSGDRSDYRLSVEGFVAEAPLMDEELALLKKQWDGKPDEWECDNTGARAWWD